MQTKFLHAKSAFAVMASCSKRARVGENHSEEASNVSFDEDSDPSGMSSAEESELDHLLASGSEIER